MYWHKVSEKLPPKCYTILLSGVIKETFENKLESRRIYQVGTLEKANNRLYWQYSGPFVKYLDETEGVIFDYWAEIPPVIE